MDEVFLCLATPIIFSFFLICLPWSLPCSYFLTFCVLICLQLWPSLCSLSGHVPDWPGMHRRRYPQLHRGWTGQLFKDENGEIYKHLKKEATVVFVFFVLMKTWCKIFSAGTTWQSLLDGSTPYLCPSRGPPYGSKLKLLYSRFLHVRMAWNLGIYLTTRHLNPFTRSNANTQTQFWYVLIKWL